jgi:NAD(P)-dependent dehydrogenase (short-subunit alcohol dehydrogenase family)
MTGFTDTDVPALDGQVFLVTGANTGIGLEASRVLAERGARVLLGCRSADKANAAIASIRETAPEADLEHIALDLGDLDSVRSAAELVNAESRLDGLVNNAGIMMPPLEHTVQGFESQFGVNHLGPFALTALLLPVLMATKGARVVNTSSVAHRGGDIDFNDINAEQGYNRAKRYGQSKLANLLFSMELQRRLEAAESSVISVACHPGIADTELSRHMPGILKLTAPLVNKFFNTSVEGAWPTLMAATSDDVAGGDYFGPTKRGETAGPAGLARANRRSQDPVLAARLWDLSIEMTGIDPAF